jgi:hypothetical protein
MDSSESAAAKKRGERAGMENIKIDKGTTRE